MQSSLERIYIDTPEQLEMVCARYANADVLAIDTEFVRTRTLFPKLGLLQVNDGKTLALIDPVVLADLSPFWALLEDGNIQKVLHACSEDLEVFLTVGHCKPVNLIDSQIIMSFLGHGLSMGYAAMVAHYRDVALDKSASRTDWIKRPLSPKQLEYAQADVEHLMAIFPKIINDITASGWAEAAQQETNMMIERKFQTIDETQLYRNIKLAWRLNSVQLYRLQQLTIWRYRQAKLKDRPIGFIAKDHTLLALAQSNPSTMSMMNSVEGAEVLDIRHKGKAMLKILKEANDNVSPMLPPKISRLDEQPGYKQDFKKIKAFINQVSENSKLAIENLASKKQINQFLSWHYKINGQSSTVEDIDILQGWRKNVIGDPLLAFVEKEFVTKQ